MNQTNDPTFRTCDIDTAGAVFAETQEMPQMVLVNGTVETRFYSPAAPESAQRFLNNSQIQSILTAKKTLYRMMRALKQQGGAK